MLPLTHYLITEIHMATAKKAKKLNKIEIMTAYLKQMQSLGIKNVNASDFGAIVEMLGAANFNADASMVATSNPDELESVYARYVADELKVSDKNTGMKMVKKVAAKMKNERRKYRAVFYYLLKEAASK